MTTGLDARDVLPVLVSAERQSHGRHPLRRLLRDRTAMVGAVLVGGFALMAVVGPVVVAGDPDAIDVANKFASPSWHHLLGTDELGRDVATRLLHGARLSIGTAVVASAGIALVGTVLGVLAGYARGVLDMVIGRTIDVLLTVPTFLLALAVTGVLGPGINKVVAAVVAVSWSGYARVVRAAVLAERAKPYVESARAAGASHARIVSRHILPNTLSPIIVLTTVDMGAVLLAISALSFLGLGVNPPTAEWGAMLAEAKTYLGETPLLMTAPGVAILLMVLGFNLLGDGLRDVLDPRLPQAAAGARRDGVHRRRAGRGRPSS
ncbi:MAG: ABC transporter permease [Actinomycetota bacterium]|nr:ABC transporter permease [Actinomycetota bacterium]